MQQALADTHSTADSQLSQLQALQAEAAADKRALGEALAKVRARTCFFTVSLRRPPAACCRAVRAPPALTRATPLAAPPQVAQLESELVAARDQVAQLSLDLSAACVRAGQSEAAAEARAAEAAKACRQRDEAQGSLKHSTEELIAQQLRSKHQVRVCAWWGHVLGGCFSLRGPTS